MAISFFHYGKLVFLLSVLPIPAFVAILWALSFLIIPLLGFKFFIKAVYFGIPVVNNSSKQQPEPDPIISSIAENANNSVINDKNNKQIKLNSSPMVATGYVDLPRDAIIKDEKSTYFKTKDGNYYFFHKRNKGFKKGQQFKKQGDVTIKGNKVFKCNPNQDFDNNKRIALLTLVEDQRISQYFAIGLLWQGKNEQGIVEKMRYIKGGGNKRLYGDESSPKLTLPEFTKAWKKLVNALKIVNQAGYYHGDLFWFDADENRYIMNNVVYDEENKCFVLIDWSGNYFPRVEDRETLYKTIKDESSNYRYPRTADAIFNPSPDYEIIEYKTLEQLLQKVTEEYAQYLQKDSIKNQTLSVSL